MAKSAMKVIEVTELDGTPFKAYWKPLAEFADGQAPLYPAGLFDLLTDHEHIT
jgi:hypothetical protein